MTNSKSVEQYRIVMGHIFARHSPKENLSGKLKQVITAWISFMTTVSNMQYKPIVT